MGSIMGFGYSVLIHNPVVFSDGDLSFVPQEVFEQRSTCMWPVSRFSSSHHHQPAPAVNHHYNREPTNRSLGFNQLAIVSAMPVIEGLNRNALIRLFSSVARIMQMRRAPEATRHDFNTNTMDGECVRTNETAAMLLVEMLPTSHDDACAIPYRDVGRPVYRVSSTC